MSFSSSADQFFLLFLSVQISLDLIFNFLELDSRYEDFWFSELEFELGV